MGELLEERPSDCSKGLVYNVLSEFPKETAAYSAQTTIQG